MIVHCENCGRDFPIPASVLGRIEYARCKSVFRVTYRFRTPCTACRRVVQIAPGKNGRIIGIPLSIATDELTERFGSGTPPEATLPRARADLAGSDAPATVRVQPEVRVSQSTAKQTGFRLLEKTMKRDIPLHVAFKAKPSRNIPVFKTLLTLVIITGSSLMIALSLLAVSDKQRTSPSQPAKAGGVVSEPQSSASPEGETQEVPLQYREAFQAVRSLEYSTAEAAVDSRSHDAMGGIRQDIFHSHYEGGLSPLYLPSIENLTSPFGIRKDPFHGRPAFHDGIDIRVPHRAEVPAALDGRVSFAGNRGGYGLSVVLDHGDGYQTLYGHLSKTLVRKGRKVNQGDLLGLAGSTGRSTGTHIHFELRRNGEAIDPLRVEFMTQRPKSAS